MDSKVANPPATTMESKVANPPATIMAYLYNPIGRLNFANLIYGIICLACAVYSLPAGLISGWDKTIVWLMFLNVAMIFIAYLLGKRALQAKELGDWRCFTVLIVASLVTEMATVIIVLLDNRSFPNPIMHTFIAGFLVAVIFGFQLILAILAIQLMLANLKVQLKFKQQFA